jgi:hypothetical protein
MIAQSFDFQVLPLGQDMLLRPLIGAAATDSPTTYQARALNGRIRNHPRRSRTHPVRLREPRAAKVQALSPDSWRLVV